MSLGDANTVSYERLHIGFTGFNIYIRGLFIIGVRTRQFLLQGWFSKPVIIWWSQKGHIVTS